MQINNQVLASEMEKDMVKAEDLTPMEKLDIIITFHECYDNTVQDTRDFAGEFFHLVNFIMKGQLPIKLSYLEDWEETLIECYPKYKGILLVQKAKEKGLTVEFTEKPMSNREHSYWYGGEVARVTKGNTSLLLEANGDVRCYYRSIENGQESEIFVKDKKNGGRFLNELHDEIKNDSELNQCIRNCEEDQYPQLEVQNNNWWEVFVLIDKQWHDLTCVVEADTYTEALEMLIDNFDTYADMA